MKPVPEISKNVQQDNEEAEGRSVQPPTEEVNEEEGEEQLQDESISGPVAEETEHHSTDNVQNQELETKKRKTRGPTKMNKVAKNPEEKVDIEFTRLENMWGKDQSHFPPFLDH